MDKGNFFSWFLEFIQEYLYSLHPLGRRRHRTQQHNRRTIFDLLRIRSRHNNATLPLRAQQSNNATFATTLRSAFGHNRRNKDSKGPTVLRSPWGGNGLNRRCKGHNSRRKRAREQGRVPLNYCRCRQERRTDGEGGMCAVEVKTCSVKGCDEEISREHFYPKCAQYDRGERRCGLPYSISYKRAWVKKCWRHEQGNEAHVKSDSV